MIELPMHLGTHRLGSNSKLGLNLFGWCVDKQSVLHAISMSGFISIDIASHSLGEGAPLPGEYQFEDLARNMDRSRLKLCLNWSG
jgi:hypothetical protein